MSTTYATVGDEPVVLVEGPDRDVRVESRLGARRQRSSRRFGADVVAGGLALAVAWPSQLPVLTGLAAATCVVVILALGQYGHLLAPRLGPQVRRVLGATGVVGVLHALVAADLGSDAAAVDALHAWALVAVALVAGRSVVHTAEHLHARSGRGARRTLVVGAGTIGHRACRRLLDVPGLGLRPVGFLDDDPLYATGPVPVLGGVDDLERIVSEQDVDAVLIGFSTTSNAQLLTLVRRAWELGVEVLVVPRLFEVEGKRTVVEHLGGLPIVHVERGPATGPALATKYAVEQAIASVALVVLAPVFALLALAVVATSGRPVFHRASRIGADGRPFQMVKFRTMHGTPETRGEADADWATAELAGIPTSEVPADAMQHALTPLGHVLRRWSLDELPQLLCVARGDMALIGPRPERVHYVVRFDQALARYGERHRLRPGITGWAQVNGLRGRTSLADRTEWDLFYVENWSPWLDLRILARTVSAVLRGTPS